MEDVLEPELPICDPHHHLFEDGPLQYSLDDLRADIAHGHHVVTSVFVEAGTRFRGDGPVELRPVGEVAHVAAQAGGDGLLAGIVGFADLRRGAAVADVLDAHVAAGRGRFRGVRHVVAWDAAPELQRGLARHGEVLRSPGFADGVATVGAAGLSFETWCYAHQLEQLAEVVRANPDVAICVDHLGGPVGIGPYAGHREESIALAKRWLAELARHDRVHLKLGGIGMDTFGSPWLGRAERPTSEEVAAEWGDLVRWAIDTFGPSRCMFESNFPVDRTTLDHVVLWNAFKRMSAGCSAAERAELFQGTAHRFYRLA